MAGARRCATRALGLDAEVYSNLVRVPEPLWDLFALPGVSLATSWYTGSRKQHAAITGRDTWRQTRSNFAEAARRRIPLRAGIIGGLVPGQRTVGGGAELLTGIGVAAEKVSHDEVRDFGRGAKADASQACGHCGRGVAAVLPDGSVTPCPMTRWLRAGSVLDTSLGGILGEQMAAATAALPSRSPSACKPSCLPDSYSNPLCTPGACKPRV